MASTVPGGRGSEAEAGLHWDPCCLDRELVKGIGALPSPWPTLLSPLPGTGAESGDFLCEGMQCVTASPCKTVGSSPAGASAGPCFLPSWQNCVAVSLPGPPERGSSPSPAP